VGGHIECKSTAFFQYDQIFQRKNAKNLHFLTKKQYLSNKRVKFPPAIAGCLYPEIAVPLHRLSKAYGVADRLSEAKKAYGAADR
jgi:hypothetical protein